MSRTFHISIFILKFNTQLHNSVYYVTQKNPFGAKISIIIYFTTNSVLLLGRTFYITILMLKLNEVDKYKILKDFRAIYIIRFSICKSCIMLLNSIPIFRKKGKERDISINNNILLYIPTNPINLIIRAKV